MDLSKRSRARRKRKENPVVDTQDKPVFLNAEVASLKGRK